MAGRAVHIFLLILLLTICATLVYSETGRIYGKIHTDQGDILEGPIRWDKNEGSWDDILDGNKDRDKKFHKKRGRRKYGDKDSKVTLFGMTIYDRDGWSSSAQSGIAFGHIDKLYRDSDDEVEQWSL